MSPTPNRSVLLIEDDPVLGESLVQRLNLEGIRTWWGRSAAEGERLLRTQKPGLIVCDMRLPDGSGEELLTRLLPEVGGTPVVVVTAFGEVDQAVRLIRAGADDYIEKPFPPQVLLDKLRAFAEWSPPAEPQREGSSGQPNMQKLERDLERLARVDTNVLITGESGVGKEVAARRLHELGDRAEAPFVAVNCAAIPAELLESEMFGHERGAFTGAAQRHEGFAERARGGTLFLDEIGEMAAPLQAKLLRLIQERRFNRVGGREALPLKARIVAATNLDLEARVAEGSFREDLYYRLAVVTLHVPPLRERPADVERLAQSFLAHFASAFRRPLPTLSRAAQDALLAHKWPGNVRELKNRVERAMVLSDAAVIEASDLFPGRQEAPTPVLSLADARDAAERDHIRRMLVRFGGRIAETAQALGVSRTTLWERMKRLGIEA
ncbi:sigma-54-dependent Fis family transcriptional regulator [Roseomonas sp. SSH11]|uniref:Sigma-54-dependent Fis family transcriptional regulator n=1 Tax=Pararoseomonas baculiformis TaxID=2820812 RepID=A0ABS4AED8_9PROT|nr:sigma-54 dependent transcriptional regulator [Pararoseomonas baculiformis]MBP0445380.1 sigma-54-dependent Fis family transcriptional regulator [Pararoseomonas baculiformis]